VSSTGWRRPILQGAVVAICLLSSRAIAGSGQVLTRPADETRELFDSADALGRARREQARFERWRARALPRIWGSSGGPCDEQVGRFCTWYEEGDWIPDPESAEVVARRRALVAYLDSVQELVPGDDWIRGQRVWYRAEEGRWEDARSVARSCASGTPWWCHALEGLALHGLGRFEMAEAAFAAALDGMDPERAERWRVPKRALDGDARAFLEREAEDPSSLDWMWTLADPLILVPGNDRKTSHYARWTVSTLKEKARNPFQISWGRDLEELTVRHGWEIGWERTRATGLSLEEVVVGHKHPEGRDFMPPGRALEDPAESGPDALRADRSSPRSLYAPAYAPVLLPMEAQVAVFPRADEFAIVATHFLPEDSTWHRSGPDERPWMQPGNAEGQPVRAGLYLVPAPGSAEDGSGDAGREILASERVGRLEGALVVEAPAGTWVVSVESWSPPDRRAGRLRRGLSYASVPPDVATLSDLLLVRGGGGDPPTLEAAARQALPRPELGTGESLAVVWELGGLGWIPETIAYALSVERADRSLLRRLGEGVGLLNRDRPLSLEWEEPGPTAPQAVLRALDLALPALDEGAYDVRLEARVPGRSPLEARTSFLVR
jgi:tetratricopeptide (TPR) repeat protein